MSPSDLKAAGEFLFGRFWQTKLACKLQVDPSTVRRWASGKIAVPGPVEVALDYLVKTKIFEQDAASR